MFWGLARSDPATLGPALLSSCPRCRSSAAFAATSAEPGKEHSGVWFNFPRNGPNTYPINHQRRQRPTPQSQNTTPQPSLLSRPIFQPFRYQSSLLASSHTWSTTEPFQHTHTHTHTSSSSSTGACPPRISPGSALPLIYLRSPGNLRYLHMCAANLLLSLHRLLPQV